MKISTEAEYEKALREIESFMNAFSNGENATNDTKIAELATSHVWIACFGECPYAKSSLLPFGLGTGSLNSLAVAIHNSIASWIFMSAVL